MLFKFSLGSLSNTSKFQIWDVLYIWDIWLLRSANLISTSFTLNVGFGRDTLAISNVEFGFLCLFSQLLYSKTFSQPQQKLSTTSAVLLRDYAMKVYSIEIFFTISFYFNLLFISSQYLPRRFRERTTDWEVFWIIFQYLCPNCPYL